MLHRIQYFLTNKGDAKNAWETNVMTVDGPPYSETLETLIDAPPFPLAYRVFVVQFPAGTRSVALSFSGRQVCPYLQNAIPLPSKYFVSTRGRG
jgi:hypothetical protein